MKRRDFIKKTTAGVAGVSSLYMCDMLKQQDAMAYPTSGGMGIEEGVSIIERGKERNTRPEIRPEILKNPRAVFLIETYVDAKKDANGTFNAAVPQIRAEGKRIAEYLFVKGSTPKGSTFIKGNFTYKPEHTWYRTSGVYTQPDFIVGVVDHLRDIGNTNIITGETATPAINRRLGKLYESFDPANIPIIEPGYREYGDYVKAEINWKNVDKSLFWKKIPYFRPIGDDDNFLINIGTLKCHLTGLTTLSIKNLQGCVLKGYGQFCTSWDSFEGEAKRTGVNMRHFQKDWQEAIEASFLKHRAAGFKRWDFDETYKRYEEKGGWEAYKKARKDSPEALRDFRRGVSGVMRHELWMHRGLDNAAVVKPQINIIEGIIGLDGEELNRDGIGDDQLVNIVIAGCSPFEVDAVGSYVMGHDPRELWYTRVAKELGYGECDVNNIDVYMIRRNGEIEPVRNISEIKRHPLGLNLARKKDPSERLFW
ncbi:DUF362 domain-containing protein [Candidatus Latescibacterota bacterium]